MPSVRLDGQGDAALGRAVELGQDHAGDVDGLGELLRLGQAVLAGGGVEDEQHLGHVPRIAVGHPPHLAQLLHQVGLGVEAAGRVGQHQVVARAAARSTASKTTAEGSPPSLPRTISAAGALGPHAELLGGRGPEGVARGHDDPAALGLLLAGDLADGGGLADAVDPDEQPHVGRARLVAQAAVAARQLVLELGLQPIQQHLGVGDRLGLGRGPQLVEDLAGGGHADVGPDERLLQLVPRLRRRPSGTGSTPGTRPACPGPWPAGRGSGAGPAAALDGGGLLDLGRRLDPPPRAAARPAAPGGDGGSRSMPPAGPGDDEGDTDDHDDGQAASSDHDLHGEFGAYRSPPGAPVGGGCPRSALGGRDRTVLTCPPPRR